MALQNARSSVVLSCSVALIPYHVNRQSITFSRSRNLDMVSSIIFQLLLDILFVSLMCPTTFACLVLMFDNNHSFAVACLKDFFVVFCLSRKLSSFFLKTTFRLVRCCIVWLYLMIRLQPYSNIGST